MNANVFFWLVSRAKPDPQLLPASGPLLPFLAQLYGADAGRAAHECVLTAATDGRDEDCRFWLAVVARLRIMRQPKNLRPERQP